MLGRFHEVSIATTDIRASVEFYERLGFSQATTTDTWRHPYGVLTDGRLFLGLHQRVMPSPTLTFVLAGIAQSLGAFQDQGIEFTVCQTGDEVFNQIAFRDPAGQTLSVLEARTYSPVTRRAAQVSLCGYFSEVSLPTGDFAAARTFWEALGFVATEEIETPYLRVPLTSDHLDIAFHRPRVLDRPALVFSDPAMPARIDRLRDAGFQLSSHLPRGLSPTANALIEAPEGTALLLLHGTE